MLNPFDAIMTELQELKGMIQASGKGEGSPAPDIIDGQELCKRLDISEPTLIRWRQKGKIPSFRIGASIRYNWPAVVAHLEKNSCK